MNPVASQPTGSSDAAAALKGASLAFQNNKPTAPTTPTPKRNNGALTAATASSSAASRSASPSKRLLPQSTSGSTVIDVEGHGHGSGTRGGGSSGHLQARVDSKSPSFIAATLAASRSASPSPMHRTPRRVSSIGGASTTSGSDAVDSLSIAPTTSLISMFERGKEGDPIKRLSPRRIPTESSEDSLPETWRAPVMLPGIAKTQSIPAKQASASDAQMEEELMKTPTRGGSTNTQPKTAKKTFIADVTQPKSPVSPLQSITLTPASPSQKLKPFTRPTPAPAKVSQEDVSAQQRTDPVQDQASAVQKPKPKPKPPLNPDPNPPVDVPTTPKTPRAAQRSRDDREAPNMSPKPSKPKPAPLNPVPRVISHSTPEVLSPKPTRPPKPVLQVSHPSPVKSVTSSTARISAQKQRPPTPPKPRTSNNKPAPVVTSTRFVKSASDLGTGEPHKPRAMAMVHAPRDRSDTMSTDDSFVSASSYQSLGRLSPPSLPARRGSVTPSIASAPISPSRGTPRPHNSSSTSLGLSNLTNAIMAGSLASSRLTPHNTGSSLPPSLPKRQRSPRLRETMRKPTSTEPEDPDHYKPHKHKLSRGKHAHHEGSRKRWRDQVTPRERKRYEALWASNRGTLLPPTVSSSSSTNLTGGGLNRDTTDLVANVVVRELWRRSRLPADELSEVWDLVDREGKGWLGRQEFVVGMWLIDQRLKGRKIPQKVSDSVWGSANGVSVKKPKSK